MPSRSNPVWRACVVAGLSLGLSAGLTACMTPPPTPQLADATLWQDAAFSPPQQPVDVSQLFTLSDEMQRYLRVELGPRLQSEGRLRGLYRALQASQQLKLDYDARITRTAAEAFEARSGNCLSLVILSAAMARSLGLNVHFQQVQVEASWSLAGDVLVVNDHVNLVLGQRAQGSVWTDDSGMSLVVDFLPHELMQGQPSRTITEATIVTMFMNNRAVEHLLSGATDDAYAWAQAALRRDPNFTPALNTLGVIYQRKGLLGPAEQAWQMALRQQADSPGVLGNLAAVQRARGLTDEAARSEARLARLQREAPWGEFRRAQAALQSGDAGTARALLERLLKRDATQRDVHVWLAQAYLQLKQPEQASRHLALAVQHSPTHEQGLYAGKLARLQAAVSP